MNDYEVTEDGFIPGNWMIWNGASPMGDTFATEAEALARVEQLKQKDKFHRWIMYAVGVFVIYIFVYNYTHPRDWDRYPYDPQYDEQPTFDGYDLD